LLTKNTLHFLLSYLCIFQTTLTAQFRFARSPNLIPTRFSLNWTQLGWCEVNFKHWEHTSPLPFEENRSHTHTRERKRRQEKQRVRSEGSILISHKGGSLPHNDTLESCAAAAGRGPNAESGLRRRVDFSEIQFLAISLPGGLPLRRRRCAK
jgi:hypothetical protein